MSEEKINNRKSFIDDIKETFIVFFQEFFSEASIEGFHYKEDEKETDIIIMDRFSYEAEKKKPQIQIVIGRGRQHFNKTTIGRRFQPDFAGIKNVKSDILPGSLLISAVSENGIESERLAAFMLMAIIAHKEQIIKVGRFHDLASTMAAVGEEQQLGENLKDGHHETSITIDYSKQLSFIITNLNKGPLVGELSFDIDTK